MAAERSAIQQEKKAEPLLIFYDSEAAQGNVNYGDVIEIAATCHPDVVGGSFESLINTKQQLCYFALKKSGITKQDLKEKPFINDVIGNFLEWIKDMVKLANEQDETINYFPVICAHGGYQFDFLILFSNLERKGFPYEKFSDLNIHFTDSFLFCKELQDGGNELLQSTRLSMDGLFQKFFPKNTIKERHRAMGDVTAMVEIFTQTPLKGLLHLMGISSTQERIDYYICQASRKLQQRILEEKLSSLDACSKKMSTKRLVREGMTYDILQTVFQNCSSFMDFWHLLKKIGIERKVAKVLTNQFGGLGLQNQGSLGYCLDAAKQNGSAVSNGLTSEDNGFAPESNGTSHRNESSCSPTIDFIISTSVSGRSTSSSHAFEQRPMDYALTSSSDEVRPRICDCTSTLNLDVKSSSGAVHLDSGEDRNISNSEKIKNLPHKEFSTSESSMEMGESGGSENWDSEINNSVNHLGTFVLQFSEVIPLSVGIDDLTSVPCKEKNSSKRRKEKTKMEMNLSLSEKANTANPEKKPMQKKANSTATNSDSKASDSVESETKSAMIQRVGPSKAEETSSQHKDSHPLLSEVQKTKSRHPKRSTEPNKNKNSKVRKTKQSNKTPKQASSVIFLRSPGSPTSPDGKEMTSFYVGDVEICVPVKKSSLNKDSLDKQSDTLPSVLENGSCDNDKHGISLCGSDTRDNNNVEGSKSLGSAITSEQSAMVAFKEEDQGSDQLVENGEIVGQDINNMEKERDVTLASEIQEGTQEEETMASEEFHDVKKDNINEVEAITDSQEGNEVSSLHGTIDACTDEGPKVEPETEPNTENTPTEPVAYEVEQNLSDTTVEPSQLPCHDVSEGPYPGMYPMPPMPYRYPVQVPCPTGIPTGYGFYPPVAPMGPMMPMFHAPPLMMYHGMPYSGPQGYTPYAGFQPGYTMPGPMYQQTMYPPCQEQEGPPIHPDIHEVISQQNRDSPDILGIPCRGVQDNPVVTLSSKACDSYATTSDEYSGSCSSHLSQEDSDKKPQKLSSMSVSGMPSSSTNVTNKSRKSMNEHRRETARIHQQEKRRHRRKNISPQERISKDKHSDVEHLSDRCSGKEEPSAQLSGASKDVKVSPNITGKETRDEEHSPSDSGRPGLSLNGSNVDVSPSSKSSPPQSSTKHSKAARVAPKPTSKGNKDGSTSSRQSGISSKGSDDNVSAKSSPPRASTKALSKDVKVLPKSTSKGTNIVDHPSSDSSKSSSSLKVSNIDVPVSSVSSPPRPSTREPPKDVKVSPKSTSRGTNDAGHPSSDSSKSSSSFKGSSIDVPASSVSSPPRPSTREPSKDVKVSPKSTSRGTNDAGHPSSDSSKSSSSFKGSSIDVPASSVSSPPRPSTREPSKDVKVSPKSTSRGTNDAGHPSSDSSKSSSSLKVSNIDVPVIAASSPPRTSTRHPSKDANDLTSKGNRDSQHRSPNARQVDTSLKGSDDDHVQVSAKPSPPRTSTKHPLKDTRVSPKPNGKGTRDAENATTDVKKPDTSLKRFNTNGTAPKSSPLPRSSTQELSKDVKVSPKPIDKRTRDAEIAISSHGEKNATVKKSETNESLSSAPQQTSEAARALKWPLSAWRNAAPKEPPKPQREVQARRRTRENPSRSATKNEETTVANFDGSGHKSKIEPKTISDNTQLNDSHGREKTEKPMKIKVVATPVDELNRKLEPKEHNRSDSSTRINYRDILIGKTKAHIHVSSGENLTKDNEKIPANKNSSMITTENNNNHDANPQRYTHRNDSSSYATRSRGVGSGPTTAKDYSASQLKDTKEKSHVEGNKSTRSP